MFLGAHTIGFSHCNRFSKRIYNFSPRNRIDPTLNLQYAMQLRQMCPLRVDPRIAINMDPATPRTFDNAYFRNLQQGRGLFASDQVLFSDSRSRSTVNLFASNNAAFQQAFGQAMTKLGRVGVLTGNKGEIRFDCTRPNQSDLGNYMSESVIFLGLKIITFFSCMLEGSVILNNQNWSCCSHVLNLLNNV